MNMISFSQLPAQIETQSKWSFFRPLSSIRSLADRVYAAVKCFFASLCRGSTLHLFEVAKQHPNRNRFPNILPNEPTRFKLEHDPSFYFNANWVLGGRAIACQGPLQSEIDEFWKMAWHADVAHIVMLANPIESGEDKCSQYWKSNFFSWAYKEISVNCKSEAVIFESGTVKIVQRTIELTKGGKTKQVTQFHMQNWPDHGVVTPEILAKLVRTVAAQDQTQPLLVHCSAGVGRTGTFLAAYQAFKTGTPSVHSIIAHLRDPYEGRIGMVQTDKQYALAGNTAQLLFEHG